MGKFSSGDLFGGLLSMKMCNSHRYESMIVQYMRGRRNAPSQIKPNRIILLTSVSGWASELQINLTFANSQRKRESWVLFCICKPYEEMKRWLRHELWIMVLLHLQVSLILDAIPNWTLQVLEEPWKIRLFEFSKLRTRGPNTLDRFARPCPGGFFPSTFWNSSDKSIGGDFLYLFD